VRLSRCGCAAEIIAQDDDANGQDEEICSLPESEVKPHFPQPKPEVGHPFFLATYQPETRRFPKSCGENLTG